MNKEVIRFLEKENEGLRAGMKVLEEAGVFKGKAITMVALLNLIEENEELIDVYRKEGENEED